MQNNGIVSSIGDMGAEIMMKYETLDEDLDGHMHVGPQGLAMAREEQAINLVGDNDDDNDDDNASKASDDSDKTIPMEDRSVSDQVVSFAYGSLSSGGSSSSGGTSKRGSPGSSVLEALVNDEDAMRGCFTSSDEDGGESV